MRYQQRPPTIDAVQFTGDNLDQIKNDYTLIDTRQDLRPIANNISPKDSFVMIVSTGSESIRVCPGEYIIRQNTYVYNVMSAAEFEATYEPVTES